MSMGAPSAADDEEDSWAAAAEALRLVGLLEAAAVGLDAGRDLECDLDGDLECDLDAAAGLVPSSAFLAGEGLLITITGSQWYSTIELGTLRWRFAGKSPLASFGAITKKKKNLGGWGLSYSIKLVG